MQMDIVTNVVPGIPDTIIKGIPEHNVADLPAVIAEMQDGSQAIVSRWRPTEKERKIIAEGGDVFLWVLGKSQPPVIVSGESPVVNVIQVPQVRIGLPTGPGSTWG